MAVIKPTQPQIARLQRRLLRWWRTHQRDLPWRRRRTPYRVWVAEMMLQQTQVATVEPYYARWLKAFPSFRALARATQDQVLKCWEGLGYYSRARNMHAAAKEVVEQLNGQLPSDVDELRRLPGIGPYTAGAIASIAFGADEPVLDGNVIRVLCRLFAIRHDPRQQQTRKDLWALAGALVPAGQAGDFNEALMDLGATICTPSSPACEACPLANICKALAAGRQNRLPLKTKAAPVPHYAVAVGVIVKNGRALIGRRKDTGLLGGLWEFPGGKIRPGESAAAAVRREVAEEVGIEIAPADEPFATVRHAYSHFRITLQAFLCAHVRGRARAIDCAAVKWVPIDELASYAFPRANQKVLAALPDALPGG